MKRVIGIFCILLTTSFAILIQIGTGTSKASELLETTATPTSSLSYLPLIWQIKSESPGGTSTPQISATPTPSKVATKTSSPTSTSTSTSIPTLTSTATDTPVPPCGYLTGNLSIDTTLQENCTYVANGNVGVLENVTLTINPGVQILFDKDAQLQIIGNLLVYGSESKPVYFLPKNNLENWGGVRFLGPQSQVANRLDFAVIRYANIAIDLTGARNVPSISNSKIEYNLSGIWSGGLYVSLVISHSRFANNTGAAISMRSSNLLSVTNSTIISNEIGIDAALSFDLVKINQNNIYGNQQYNLRGSNVLPGAGDISIDATNNWWGTTNTQTISSLIFDCSDDLEYGCVNFQPISNSEIIGTP